MTDYIVVAKKKGVKNADWEPVHPGHTTYWGANHLFVVLKRQNIDAEIWTTEKWDIYDDQIRAEAFPEET